MFTKLVKREERGEEERKKKKINKRNQKGREEKKREKNRPWVG
jgi:hypothetical protein